MKEQRRQNGGLRAAFIALLKGRYRGVGALASALKFCPSTFQGLVKLSDHAAKPLSVVVPSGCKALRRCASLVDVSLWCFNWAMQRVHPSSAIVALLKGLYNGPWTPRGAPMDPPF